MRAPRRLGALICLTLAACASGTTEIEQGAAAAVSCREIAEDVERLACLDRAADTLAETRIFRENEEGVRTPYRRATPREAVVADAEPERSAPPAGDEAASPAAAHDEGFGGERLAAAKKATQKPDRSSLRAAIVEIVVGPFEKITVTLENGQVWRQLDADDRIVRFPGERMTYTADISRGVLGGYSLKILERDRVIRVRRIR